MKPKQKLYGALVACFVLAAGVCYSCTDEETLVLPEEQETGAETQAETWETAGPETKGLIVVHICGEVKAPGLYRVPEGSRYGELLELAGGPTERGAPDLLNLAAVARDGEQIRVPAVGETAAEPEGSGKVNINTASLERLLTLPGIGEAKARAILAYRESAGPFGSVEELMAVPGIKDGVFSKLRSYITVGGS